MEAGGAWVGGANDGRARRTVNREPPRKSGCSRDGDREPEESEEDEDAYVGT